MKKFFIKKLTITGEGKTPSMIEFNDGLNIIHGVSDTGKTCIIKCIDFVFGNQKIIPIPIEHGYTNIKLDIITANGSLSLEREIGDNKVNIISTDSTIMSNKYNLKDLGTLLLNLIGIIENPMIIKNKRYKKSNLTWRTFMHSFIINEENVIQSEPILISKESTAKTASISALLYLISAPDFSRFNENEDKKIKEARKKAVEKYIYGEISYLKEQKELLKKQLEKSNYRNPEEEIENLINELKVIENKITEQINTSENLLALIINKKDKIAQYDVLLNKYSKLHSQYSADIKRLSFIVDGEKKFNELPTDKHCPFCNGVLNVTNDGSYIEASQAELNRIFGLLKDLEEIESSVLSDKATEENNLKSICIEKKNIDNLVESKLTPKAYKLKKSIESYKELIAIETSLSTIEKLQMRKSSDLEEILSAKEEKLVEYRPKEHFPDDFEVNISNILENILRECKYENYISSKFSLEDFDIIVNSKKKNDFGKGFKAFLNTITTLVFRKYLYLYGEYYSDLIVIDSPLLSLEQGVADTAPESMKSALMNYLMKHQEIGQTIIIENKIPNLNYEDYGVKMHNFTKGKSEGRYGLLADVIE